MTLTLVIVGGVALLVVVSVCIGMSMDTETQRREWRRVARARRELRQLTQGEELELCEDCPFRVGRN
jgi:hypothetical protein